MKKFRFSMKKLLFSTKKKFNQVKRDELPILSSDYPWLVAQTTHHQIFYTLHNAMSQYRCRIPELVGRRIQGCFHGWLILSKRNPQDIEWSLWNPVVSKLIWLPRMILKDEDDDDIEFHHCCLSSPPDDPGSVLLLMRSEKRSIVWVFCNEEKRKRWTEISYSEEMKNITDDGVLAYPTCFNGNIYALCNVSKPSHLIQLHITLIEEEQVVINLVPVAKLPKPDYKKGIDDIYFLKGSCTQLFIISVCLDNYYKPCDVHLYQLDMGSMVGTEIKGLNDAVFFVNLDYDEDLVSSSPPMASELKGGYIHILGDFHRDEIYSYNIKDKTISMSSMRCLGLPSRKSISIWTIPEFRLPRKAKCKLQGDHDDQMVQLVRSDTTTATNDGDDDDDEGEEMNEAPLLNIAFDVLENIMKFCVGIEYLNFRATCKLCRLAAPVIQWSNENGRKRLQTYSLASPWLMVIDKSKGILTFTDPMFGDNTYIMKASPVLLSYYRIVCSRHGWLLLQIQDGCVVFFNPFTSDIRKLPVAPLSDRDINFSFSAPPTSPNCMVVAFSRGHHPTVFFHRIGAEPSWYTIPLDENPHNCFWFPIFYDEDVYTLFAFGGVQIFREIDDQANFSWETVAKCAPTRRPWAKYYQVKCNQHHLLVMVEQFGEPVQVFKLNDCTRKWEEIDCLGKHMIYICDASCVCMDAKTPEMENKIYFPILHSRNNKIVFYSLDTCRFHTFNGRNVEKNLIDLFGTKQTVYPCVWIEPTWS